MDILYCGDCGVCPGIFLSVLSLAKHSAEALHIHILTASTKHGETQHRAISKEFADSLLSLSGKNCTVSVTLYDITERFASELPQANMDTRFTPLCMLRLYADTVEGLSDRLLYLDADVLCRADFSELSKIDISHADIAGVPDRYGKWFFGNILRHDYLNSGVLVMNMARIRENELFRKCRAICRTEKLFMPDQSALNRLAEKHKLPARFNNQGRMRCDTVFKHFTTYFELFPYVHPITVKPWQTDAVHKKLKIFEFDDIFDEFRRLYNE